MPKYPLQKKWSSLIGTAELWRNDFCEFCGRDLIRDYRTEFRYSSTSLDSSAASIRIDSYLSFDSARKKISPQKIFPIEDEDFRPTSSPGNVNVARWCQVLVYYVPFDIDLRG